MSEKDFLKEYHRKRNFDRTSEPFSDTGESHEQPIFVIQKHDASHLHYDFRLEVDGVLKSWAVPKGPSTNPAEKRLAVATEDHPIEYANFEGNIPEGEYGGGTVMVWDAGTYENLKEEDKQHEKISMKQALDEGHATFRLHGKKLSGGYALIRTKRGKDQWLLIKMDDDEADARRNPVSTECRSVLTERTMEEIKAEKSPKK